MGRAERLRHAGTVARQPRSTASAQAPQAALGYAARMLSGGMTRGAIALLLCTVVACGSSGDAEASREAEVTALLLAGEGGELELDDGTRVGVEGDALSSDLELTLSREMLTIERAHPDGPYMMIYRRM